MDNKQHVQIKFNQYCYKYQGKDLSKPEQNLLREISLGILRSGHVHYHLEKADLHERLAESHISANRCFLSRCPYLIVDGSDVTKPFASKMEGLGRVHDGSTGEIGNGYWLMNMIGVEPDAECLHMLNSRLYSFSEYEDPELSENKVILEMIGRQREEVSTGQIVVIDRGGDRRVLIEQFLSWEQEFIIRQVGNRDLISENEKISLKELASKIHLIQTVEVKKVHGGRAVKRKFSCGAIKVKFPHQYQPTPYAKDLWLVRMRDSLGAESWYLTNLKTSRKKEAISTVLEGYGWRWRIEEVHREIKQDYGLEKLSLRRYNSLKNFMVIFWVMMNFLYQYLYDKGYEIILSCPEPLLYRGRISELKGFIYYKLAYAVRLLFLRTSIRDMHPIRKIPENQLSLQFL